MLFVKCAGRMRNVPGVWHVEFIGSGDQSSLVEAKPSLEGVEECTKGDKLVTEYSFK